MTKPSYEVNFDFIGGMAGWIEEGNANPRLAALQGLNKMKLLASLGIKQAVLPPEELPSLPALRKLGFDGTNQDILNKANRQASWLIPQVATQGNLSATVSPSIDCSDSHLHFTPANLASTFHVDGEFLIRLLSSIFKNPVYFEHHSPLPSVPLFFDEGAPNSFRFCKSYGSPGVQFFTFGKSLQPEQTLLPSPDIYPAKQTKEASEAIVRLHRLYPGHAQFGFQNPNAIDEGASHAHLLALCNQNVLMIHAKALWKQTDQLMQLKETVSDICGTELTVIEIAEKDLSLKEALATSFFLSQLVTLSDNSMALICPLSAKGLEEQFLKDVLHNNNNPIGSVHFVDLSETLLGSSLKVVMNGVEMAEIPESLFFTEYLYNTLVAHVNTHYPTTLSLADLANPHFYQKSCDSLNEICRILNLRGIYSFQRI